MTQALNESLFKRYGFADRRYKSVQFDRAIALDRMRADFDAAIHCRFFVRVFDGDMMVLSYMGNRPYNADLDALQGRFLRPFRLEPETPEMLRGLALEYRKIQGRPGDDTWVHAGEGVAVQLEAFAQSLEEFMRASTAASP